MRLGIIYKITIGNKRLYGSTLFPLKRELNHLWRLKNNKHDNFYAQKEYNLTKSFKFEIIKENIPENILRIVESIWIGATCSKILDNRGGINIIDGHCITFSKETLKRKSDAQKRVMGNLTLEEKKERIEKMLKTKKGKWKEIGSKISISKRNNKKENWNNKQIKPVIQWTKDKVFIKLWASAYQVEKEKDYKSSCISRVCKNYYGSKTYKNNLWTFATSEEIEKYKAKK
jgi:hypothetical protein